MFQTGAKFNNVLGDYEFTKIRYLENVEVEMGQSSIQYKDEQGNNLFQMSLVGGKLQSQTYNSESGQFNDPVSLTPDTPTELQINRNQPNGYCGLNAESQIPVESVPIDALQTVYTTGLLFEMTSPTFYTKPPKIGDMFIPIDSPQSTYLLTILDFQQLGSWQILSSSDPVVSSVNNQTGNVYITYENLNQPQSDLSLNQHKITNLAKGVSSTDAFQFGQSLQHQFVYAYVSSDLTSFNSTYNLPFDSIIQPPQITPQITRNIAYNSTTGVFSLAPGIYKFEYQVLVQYKISTQTPVSFQLYASIDGLLSYSIRLSDRTESFTSKKSNSDFVLVNNTQQQDYTLQVIMNTTHVAAISSGSCLLLTQLY